MERKKAIVAQFIKSANKIAGDQRISGKTNLVKIVCFAELERGLKTEFDFKPDHYGLHDEDILKIAEKLEKEGLIQTEIRQVPYQQSLFKATEKLVKLDTGLSQKEIKIIENTLREYWRKRSVDLSKYCKEMYVNKDKKRVDKEVRQFRLEEDDKPLKELIKASKHPDWWKNAPTR